MGLALGSALNHYMLNLFGPPLIAEFGWHKSQFALVGSLSLISLFFIPIAGRFTDRYGARIAAIVGFTAVPLCFVAFSLMSGNILEFYAITLIKNILGVMTTSLVFCRVIVERFDLARGMALSIAMTGPPLIGAVAVPIVGEVIDTEGWRAGYRVLAMMSAAGGLFAVLLMGKGKTGQAQQSDQPRKPHVALTRKEFFAIARQPAFPLLIGGMFLCNFPQIIVSSQLKLVVYESGAASTFATWLISLYAVAVIIGRFISGYALDRIQPHIVAVFALGLPAVGLMMLATPFDAGWILLGSVALVGLAQGAEGDVGAMLTSRKFDLQHYSFIYSFVIASMGAASAVGSLVLSYTLHRTDSFNTFLVLAAIVTVFGAICFYLTGRYGKTEPAFAAPTPQSA